MTPRPESRLSELESKMAIQDARIRELSEDTAEEFRTLRRDMQQGFDQAHAFVQERFTEINERFDKVEQRLDKMEGRLDALSTDVNELKISQVKQNQKLDQILALLQRAREQASVGDQ